MHTSRGSKRRKRFAAAAVFGALFFSCVIAEIGFRIAAHFGGNREIYEGSQSARSASVWQKSIDPELVYELRPNFVKNGVRYTNDFGIMREDQTPLDKPDGVVRLVVLGDSIAAGLFVRSREHGLPFPEILGEMLNEQYGQEDRRFEVLNFGTDGYNTAQEARLFELKASRFQADLVVLQLCANDGLYSMTPTIWFLDEERPLSYLAAFMKTRFCMFFKRRTTRPLRYAPVLDSQPDSIQRFWKWQFEPGSIGWQRIENGLERIAEVAHRQGTPVLCVVFPLFSEEPPLQDLDRRIRKRMTDAARDRGFTVLDLHDAYAGRAMDEVSEDVLHPSRVGHGVAAKRILLETIRILDENLSLSHSSPGDDSRARTDGPPTEVPRIKNK